MVINLEKGVFKERDFKGLNFFIQLCTYNNRYEIYTEIDEVLKNSKEFKRLDYDDQCSLENNYNSLITNQLIGSDVFLKPKYVITTEIKEEENYFTINEAIRYFIQPVSIILENSKNDGYFVNAIFKYFATDTRIQNNLNNNWIQFENAGGCTNIINFIEGKMQSFNSLPKTDKSKYLRCFVLMDSDKLHPTDKLKSNKLKTLKELVKNNIPRHILRKRSIENYVPIKEIASLRNNYPLWIDSYNNLSNQQKDYFSIEKGLCGFDENHQPKKTKVQINLDTNNLFDEIMIEPIINLILVNGLKYQGYGSFKGNFPKLFELPILNKDFLKERANSDELENIITKINKLL